MGREKGGGAESIRELRDKIVIYKINKIQGYII